MYTISIQIISQKMNSGSRHCVNSEIISTKELYRFVMQRTNHQSGGRSIDYLILKSMTK
jgi:hypothetical protein